MEEDGAAEVIPEILDLFTGLPTQVGIKKAEYKRIDPIASLDNSGAINFTIRTDDSQFLDLSRFLISVTTRITDGDGATINSRRREGADDVHNDRSNALLINGAGSTWFKSLTVKVNGTAVDMGDGMYAYRADLDDRLSYTKEAKESQLTISGFDEEVYPFDDLDEGEIHFGEPADANANVMARAFVRRYERSKNGKRLQMLSKIHSGLFEQGKPLPPGTTLDLCFERNEPEFMLLTKRREAFKASVIECYILAHYLTIDEQIQREISDEIYSNGRDIRYNVRRVKMFAHSRVPGNHDLSIVDMCNGEVNLPRRIFMGMVKQTAAQGDVGQDPFNYHHFNITDLKFTVGGEVRPYPEMKFDFRNDEYVQGLFSLLEATGSMLTDHDIGITYENYPTRNVLFGANFTGMSNEAGEAFELPETKKIDAGIRIGGAGLGGNPILIIVYAEYDAEIVLTSEKRVLVFLDG